MRTDGWPHRRPVAQGLQQQPCQEKKAFPNKELYQSADNGWLPGRGQPADALLPDQQPFGRQPHAGSRPARRRRGWLGQVMTARAERPAPGSRTALAPGLGQATLLVTADRDGLQARALDQPKGHGQLPGETAQPSFHGPLLIRTGGGRIPLPITA
ncbi:hypothetical protein SZ55_3315 [Pseudomonas sp. FeS53a]|nr:hypothetical protein SZ55_3315 [Pseudomonas sp. FeS53a]